MLAPGDLPDRPAQMPLATIPDAIARPHAATSLGGKYKTPSSSASGGTAWLLILAGGYAIARPHASASLGEANAR